ncbi:hypothetical protein LshimejAT787_1105350 [Lyophyllum shimeji]|uniref:Uncharacterized protein n=1 Tax=Lyophyllum shimeji TaxID=47721 RepID=A0A9P3USI7_LYOSH|nr:hypothetical protein LshimejAT787_1105350 [Lyophyllum shimeji]
MKLSPYSANHFVARINRALPFSFVHLHSPHRILSLQHVFTSKDYYARLQMSRRPPPSFHAAARTSADAVVHSAGHDPSRYVDPGASGFAVPGSAMHSPHPVVTTASGDNWPLPATLPSAAIPSAEVDGRSHFESSGTQSFVAGGQGEAGYGPSAMRAGVAGHVTSGGQAGVQIGTGRSEPKIGKSSTHRTARRDAGPVLDIVKLYAVLKATVRPSASSCWPSTRVDHVNAAAILQSPATTPPVRHFTLVVGSSGQCVSVAGRQGVVTGQDIIDALEVTFSDYLRGCGECAGVCRCMRMATILDTLRVADDGMELAG